MLRDERRTPIAGATDLYVALNFGTLAPQRFVDLAARSVAAHRHERRHAGHRRAHNVHHAIQSPVVSSICRCSSKRRGWSAAQIQNRGTRRQRRECVVGWRPLPVFAAADANVVLRSAAAERRVAFREFYTGYRASVMQPDELIVAIEVPRVDGTQWFRKVGTRAAQAISKVVVAAVRGEASTVAFGSVGPTVVRAWEAERLLSSGLSIDDASAPRERHRANR
jgi:CO/xanthine dehydrogenase FAD-binding subunit